VDGGLGFGGVVERHPGHAPLRLSAHGTHYDVVVGHDDSPSHPTHLMALNLRGRILLIEFPGGDSAKARISTGPQLLGTDADRAPVTVQVQDVNGDGHPDLLVTVQGTQLLYLNQDVNGVWQFVWQPTAH
jgi:hypothetical protein